jgi:CRP/FNR family transcriptional regulator, cyclic AMP receptor protein
MDTALILSRIPWYEKLPESTRRAFCRFMQVRSYRKKRQLFYQGDLAETIYLVLEGSVRCIKWRDDGNTFLLQTYTSGKWLALPEVLNEGPYLSDAELQEDSLIASVLAADIAHLSEQSGFEGMLIKELAAGYYPLHDLLDSQSAENRIIRFLQAHLDLEESLQCVTITQNEIAGITGLSRETVNKQLKILQSSGFIRKERGRIVIENLTALMRDVE